MRRACIPAVNGVMTARALAAHYAALIGAGVGGVRLLPPARAAAATVPLPNEPDVVWGLTAARALGYLLGGRSPTASPATPGGRRSAFGYPGIGGSIGFADPEHGLAVGIAMTTPQGGGAAIRPHIATQVRQALGVPPQPAA